MQQVFLDLFTNSYVIGGVVALILQRWVAPPVASAIGADIQTLWQKIFPPKTVAVTA